MNIDFFMSESVKEAKKALIDGEIPIGGLLVDNKTESVIVRSYNKINKLKNAMSHCEILIIIEACKKLNSKYLNNTTLFVTLEPCAMCAAAISEVHISKVYFGAYDEKYGGLENLSSIFKKNNIYLPEFYGGIFENESSFLLKQFFKNKRT